MQLEVVCMRLYVVRNKQDDSCYKTWELQRGHSTITWTELCHFLSPSHSGIFMTMAIAFLRKNIVEANQISNFMSISDLPLCSTNPTPPVILSTLLLNGPKVEVMLWQLNSRCSAFNKRTQWQNVCQLFGKKTKNGCQQFGQKSCHNSMNQYIHKKMWEWQSWIVSVTAQFKM